MTVKCRTEYRRDKKRCFVRPERPTCAAWRLNRRGTLWGLNLFLMCMVKDIVTDEAILLYIVLTGYSVILTIR